MIILGINAFEEKPSACLVIDGALKCFSEEDRFTRLKGSYGHFPIHAIRWCLQSEHISMKNVDKIAFSWGCWKYPLQMLGHLAKIKVKSIFTENDFLVGNAGKDSTIPDGLSYLRAHSPEYIQRKIRDSFRSGGIGGAIPEIVFVEHHLAHAFQAFYQSPFEDAAVLVADGSGEEHTVSGFHFSRGSYTRKITIDVPFSLGWFYAAFTAYLGFRPNMDEGKLMGLAAYGETRKNDNKWLERFDKIISYADEKYNVQAGFFKFGPSHYHPKYTDALVKYLTSFQVDLSPLYVTSSKNEIHLNNEYVDLAYAAQTHLEKITQRLAQKLLEVTGSLNLCCAGGIFMNCKVNGALLDHTGVENIFIHPAASDDGSSIGAAFYVSEGLGQSPRNILENVQLGPRYTNDEIEEALITCHISYTKPDNICFNAAELIAKEKTVGWFQGGAEMGARALGGRSIVAYPGNPGIKDELNANVKFRELWRPYCPSMTSESRASYFEDPIETPFMIVARTATDMLKTQASSVVHVDGSIRPQTVNKDILPKWHQMIDNLRSFQLDPVVLNTSFNIRGEPIVCSPYDAIRTFYATGLDALVMEDCLITK